MIWCTCILNTYETMSNRIYRFWERELNMLKGMTALVNEVTGGKTDWISKTDLKWEKGI